MRYTTEGIEDWGDDVVALIHRSGTRRWMADSEVRVIELSYTYSGLLDGEGNVRLRSDEIRSPRRRTRL
jgi:hypothetical protein